MGSLSNTEIFIYLLVIMFTSVVLGFALGIAYQQYEINKHRKGSK